MQKDKFKLWHELTITERGKLINTLLLISTGTLGFSISQLLNKSVEKTCSCTSLLIGIGCLFILINIVILMFVNVQRVKLFNDIAKEYTSNEESAENIELKLSNTRKNNLIRDCLTTSLWILMLGELLIAIGFTLMITNRI